MYFSTNIFKFIRFKLLLIGFQTFGQDEFVIPKQFESSLINQNVWVSEGEIRNPQIADLINAPQSQFKKNTASQDVNYGYNRPNVWCKFSFKNNSTTNDFRLIVEQSRLDSLELYIVKNNVLIDEFPLMGRHTPIKERITIDRNYVYPIAIPKDSSLTFYLRSTRKFGLHGCILTLKEKSDYYYYNATASIQFGFIFGCSLITALIGLALYLFIREKTYLAYSLYCFSSLLVGVSDAGYVHSYLHFPAFQNTINIATVISFYILVSCHIFFTIELLNVKFYKSQWFYYVGKYAIVLFLGLAIALCFPLPYQFTWWIVLLSYYSVFFMDAYIAITILIGIQKRSTSVYFYMFGFFLTLFVFTIVMLANFNILDNVNSNMEILYFTPLIEIIVMVIGLSVRFKDSIRDRFIAQKKLSETQKQIITIQEDERTRIASDLHDDVGNSLAALKVKFNQENRPEEIERIQEIINDLRNITHNIMPVNFKDTSLDKMLERLINRFENNKKIDFEYISAGKFVKLENEKELSIYRIVDELITNLLKHSDAKNVSIQLIYQDEQLILSIEDDGKPFALENQKADAQKIGIRSLLARLNYIHAKFHTSTDKNGNILIIDIPYQYDASDN
jgi:signal transduction histidine kinase